MNVTEKELNFSIEASNLTNFRKLNNNIPFVYSPYVIKELSGNKVITMEYIRGIKITDIKKLRETDYDLNDISKKLILSYFKQVFEDGFFHGDPHPGNLLIRNGQICFLDFGIIGNLPPYLKDALNDAIISVANKDIDLLISVLMSIGTRKGPINRDKLYDDIDYLFTNYLSVSLKNIQMSLLLKESLKVQGKNNISLPRDLTVLIRGIIIIEGVVSIISPEIRMLDIAIPYVKNQSKNNLIRNLDIDELLLKTYNFSNNSLSLPGKIIELSNSLINGRTKIKMDITSLDKSIKELNKMTNRIIFALIICSMIIGSSQF